MHVHLSIIYVNSWHGLVRQVNSMVLYVLSPQKCSLSCAYVQHASLKNLLKTSLHKYYLHLHYCILFSLNCSIMIYIHTITDLFIRKPARTSVICDNTGTCPNSRVCINFRYCQCCLKQLNPQFCNRF